MAINENNLLRSAWDKIIESFLSVLKWHMCLKEKAMKFYIFFSILFLTISCNSSQNYFQKNNMDSLGINNPETDPVNGPPVAFDLKKTIKNDSDYVLELEYSDPEEDHAAFCELNNKRSIKTSDCLCVDGKCSVLIYKNLNFSGEGSFSFTIKTPDSQITTARGELTILNSETSIDVVDPKDPKIDCEKLKASNKVHELELTFTVDNEGTAWINGNHLGSSLNWQNLVTYKTTIKSGCHLLAIKGEDKTRVVSGLIASLKIDGKVVWVTGNSNEFLKVYGPQTPPSDWNQFDFDDSMWGPSFNCSNTSHWIYSDASQLSNLGAKWIWWTTSCNSLQKAYFRLGFTVKD